MGLIGNIYLRVIMVAAATVQRIVFQMHRESVSHFWKLMTMIHLLLLPLESDNGDDKDDIGDGDNSEERDD